MEQECRLQVYMARAGVASRRSSEALIAAGRVSVNGVIVTAMGSRVSDADVVCLDGVPLAPESIMHYILLNKPPEYLCAASDPEGRKLALELLPKNIKERLYNVGRLDYRSSGLIIFTNDGQFAAKVSHPSSNIEKEYLIQAAGLIPDFVIDSFLRGIVVEDVLYFAKSIKRIDRRTIKIVLVEGKNREIRKVFSFFHLHPDVLCRIRIGTIEIGDLAEGTSRPLTEAERMKLIS